MTTSANPLDLLARTIEQTGRIVLVLRTRPDQANLPTPCTEWNVRQLINHLVYDANLFTSMVDGSERPAPGEDLSGDDWPGAYEGATARLLQTWQRRGLDGTLGLGRLGQMPASWSVGQHIAVHGWDLATLRERARVRVD